MAVKNSLIALCYRFGIQRLFTPRFGGHTSILLLHRVSSGFRCGSVMDSLEVSQEYIEQFIVTKKREGWRFISLDYLLENFDECAVRKRNMVVTLDDGYRDNFTHAYPVFRKHEVPFTVYVTNSFPNNTAVQWWYPVASAVQAHGNIHFEWRGHGVDISGRNQKIGFSRLSAVMKSLKPEEQRDFLADFLKLYPCRCEIPPAMTWDDIRSLADDELCTIGCHTLNHRSLARLSEDEAVEEIVRSKQELEAKTGKTVHHLAYPFGKKADAGPREERLTKEAGFRSAVTTSIGNVLPVHRDALFRLPRIPLYEGKGKKEMVELYLSGMYTAIENRFQAKNL